MGVYVNFEKKKLLILLFAKFTNNLGMVLKRGLGKNFIEYCKIPMTFYAYWYDKQALKIWSESE